MKIPSVMWSIILFDLKSNNEKKLNKEIYSLIKEAKLSQYEYLKEQYPYSDTIWAICKDLKEIDLEYNYNLKKLFFQHWKNIKYSKYSEKIRIYKNIDMPVGENFNNEIKKYLAQNIVDYPCIMDLYRFRKEISQKDLKKGLNNIYNEINFFSLKNHPKEDYWGNHISPKEEEKLLDLIELSGMKKEELIKFSKIGFFNQKRQARFDRLYNLESKIPLLENNDRQVYLIKIKINTVILLKEDLQLETKFLKNATKYIYELIKNAIKTENVEMINVNTNININNTLEFITEDKEVFDRVIIKRNAIIDWIENNKVELIEAVKDYIKSNKTLLNLNKETKELAEKIIFKNKIENKLFEKNIKIKNIKKI
jgi:hypothetical protein